MCGIAKSASKKGEINMFDNVSIAVMYAVTPCHAGSGSALGVVDLPIQRERHTNWPMIQASGVKGAFRANFDRFKSRITTENDINLTTITESIFGTDKGNSGSNDSNSGYAGSLSVSDAKILAYPMRSNVSPFVWITCPSVLKRLSLDLEIAGMDSFDSDVFSRAIINENDAIILSNDGNAIRTEQNQQNCQVLLEDFEVTLRQEPNVEAEFNKINSYFIAARRLLLVSDEVFNYGVTDCTQIMAQIAIDSKTGTTATGSLRYQEELPSDTIMYTVIHWGDSKNNLDGNLTANIIKDYITNRVIKDYIQIAGDETCGRGIFKLSWFSNVNQNTN